MNNEKFASLLEDFTVFDNIHKKIGILNECKHMYGDVLISEVLERLWNQSKNIQDKIKKNY